MTPPKLVHLLMVLGLVCRGPVAGSEKAEKWLELRTPHFTVVTNGAEGKVRRVAEQFEVIRAVFQKVFPNAPVDPGQPVIILAVKDENTLRTLLPQFWEKKGQIHPAGIFLGGQEKHYIALQLDLPTADRYHSVYHEYVHLLTSRAAPLLPAWLSEGLAEFYASSRLGEKEVLLGAPDEANVLVLRQKRLLPLEVLLSVDQSSPYYNDQDKVPLFYAQSWALTHYLLINDWREKRNRVGEFVRLLEKDVSRKEAAERAFGDLKQLQKALESYIERFSLTALRAEAPADVDEKTFVARELSPAQSAAVRGDFLVRNRRPVEGRALLEEALRHDANCAPAHESMGLLFFQEGQRDEAAQSFAQAVKLDSKSYLAHYLHAVLLQQDTQTPEARAEAETHLQRAIELNNNFAPGYAELARLYSLTAQKLEMALGLARRAVVLEPSKLGYYLLVANILLSMDQIAEAIKVAERARALSKSLNERATADSFLESARWYLEQKEAIRRAQEEAQASAERRRGELEERKEAFHQMAAGTPPEPDVEQGKPAGRSIRTAAEGKILQVRCAGSRMNLTLGLPTHKIDLHAKNYSRVEFLTTNWTPPAPFHPCQHIQGRRARIVYTAGGDNPGEIVSVEVRK